MGSTVIGPGIARPTGKPIDLPEPLSSPQGYKFPIDKLKRRMEQSDKIPLVLVSCGSFSPITILHLQMFELSEKYIHRDQPGFEIVGNYLSPCSYAYGKDSLVPDNYRLDMCKLAVENESDSVIMIDPFEILRRDEAGEPTYTRTVDAVRHFDHEINDVLGGIQTTDGDFVKARVMLLIGADLALTMGDPKVWTTVDIDVLLGHYGAFIVERPTQCDIQDAIKTLRNYHDNIFVVPSVLNDVSSTKVRSQIRNGETALDVPKSVYDYIQLHQLYQDDGPKSAQANGANGDVSS